MSGRSTALRLRGVARRPLAQILGTVLVLSFAHLPLIASVLQNGDAAVYAEQIEHQDLSARTTHVGYMLVGIISNKVLPFDTDRNLNLMCLMFATAGAVAAAMIVRRVGGSPISAVFGCLLTMGLQPYLRGAVLAEVDTVAAALIVIAVAGWVYERRVAAGIAYGYAMLITPLAAFSLPIFLASYLGSKRGLKAVLEHALGLLVFGVVALAVYTPFVFLYWHDYWEGGRGLLHAPRQPWDVGEQVARSMRFFSTTALPWFLLSFVGGIWVSRARSVFVGTLMATVVAAAAGERFLDVPVQLPQLCFCAIFAVLTIDKVSHMPSKVAALVCFWLVAAFPNYKSERNEIRAKVQLVNTYRAMAAQTPKLMVVGLDDSWIDGLPFERYVYHRTKLGLGLDFRQFAGSRYSIARDRRDHALWLVREPSPTLMLPFARNWNREYRSVLGRSYEVWIPRQG